MLSLLTCLLFSFASLQGSDFYEYCNASIDVLPFKEDLIASDVYIRAFKDIETELPRYLFQFNDFPKDAEITVSLQRVAQQEREAWRQIYKFYLKPSGMIIDNGDPIGYMLCFSAKGCLPGERISFMFETASGFKKAISFIPNPLTCKSRMGNALVKAELLSLDPTFFRLDFPGLKPKENVKISSESHGSCQGPFKHNALDPFIFSPDVKGYTGGLALITVGRKTTQKFKLELPWGSQILKEYSIPGFFRP